MSTFPAPYVEPWLRGTYSDVPAVGRAVLHALDLALDDITKWTEGLTDLEVHATPLDLPPVAFHLPHIADVEVSFSTATERIRTLSTADFNTFRGVGRKQLPTSIGGALIHVADHTQRHVGQVVTTAKVLMALRS